MNNGHTVVTPEVRVLVVDSTNINTELLAGALRRDLSLSVTTCDSNAKDFRVAAELGKADVLVVSSSLEEQTTGGCEAVRELRALHPDVRAVILIDSSKRELVLEAFRAGAKGVFARNESVESLLRCIHAVHDGQVWANSEQMAYAFEALATTPMVRAVDARGLNLLSKREMEIVRNLSEGLTNREIGERLGLSQHTVKNHLFRVFDKLGVSSRVELLFMTLSHGATAASQLDLLPGKPVKGDFDRDTSLMNGGAATQESPADQLALAQMYAGRRRDPMDLVHAYVWYSIANEYISRARAELNDAMSSEQFLEAEKRITDWLRKAEHAHDSPGHPTADERHALRTSASSG